MTMSDNTPNKSTARLRLELQLQEQQTNTMRLNLEIAEMEDRKTMIKESLAALDKAITETREQIEANS